MSLAVVLLCSWLPAAGREVTAAQPAYCRSLGALSDHEVLVQAVLTDAVSGRPVPVSMIQGALSNRYLHLMWQLAELQVPVQHQ